MKILQHWAPYGVQWVGLGSNLKTRNASTTFSVQQAAQQRRLFLVQSRIPTRDEIVEFQLRLTSLPRGDTRKWVTYGATEENEV